MQYAVDIVLLAVFVLSIVFAAKKGFFVSLFELGAYVIASISAKLVANGAAPIIFDTYLYQNIKASLTDNLSTVSSKDFGAQIEQALNQIPEGLNGIMQMIGIDKQQLISKISGSNLTGEAMINNVMDSIVSPICQAVIRFLIFIVCAVIFTVLLRIAVKLLDKVIKKLIIVKQLNTGLGAILGAIKGLLLIVLIVLIIGVAVSLTGSEKLNDLVNDSLIVKAIRGLITSISGYNIA